ncbi:MAG: hypothetical protein ACYDCO_20785 [Armatimonadota bacterium]
MLASILAALGMCADGVAEGLYAVRHGFSARAAGLGYLLGAIIGWLYGVVTPVTFTVESITIATKEAKSRPQILYIVALSAVPSIILGLLGWYSAFIAWLNPAVIGGVIAGVGIILTRVGVTYLQEKPTIAGASTLAGAAAYFLTGNLVYVIIAAVLAGTLVAHYLPPKYRLGEKGNGQNANGQQGENGEQGQSREAQNGNDTNSENGGGDEEAKDRFGFMGFNWGEMFSRSVLIGAFSVFALRTGAVFSYATVNAELADHPPAFDGVTVMAGVASLASALFGGSPVETTPAPMAAAPQPVFSTVLFMFLMAGIAFFGLVRRVGEYVPLQAIAGFLIVLGIPVIMPNQLPLVLDDLVPGATALAVTALSNPFYGIILGMAVFYIVQWIGGI